MDSHFAGMTFRKGDCRTDWQLRRKDCRMHYNLSADGVITVSGNDILSPVPAPDAYPFYDDAVPEEGPTGWTNYTSGFREMDFHTVVIENGVKCLDTFCLKDCKNLRKVILPEGIMSVYARFADGAALDFFEEDGLLFLGTPENPRYALMGCAESFNNNILEIPEGTVIIAHEAFLGKDFIEEVDIPRSLVYMGRQSFAGTSIRRLFLPEGKLANDEWILAFDSAEFDFSLKYLSLPLSMHDDFLNSKDWYLRLGCDIAFRNPDGSTAEFYPSLTTGNQTQSERPDNDDSEGDQWIEDILGS